MPEVRGNPLAAHAETIRAELPELRLVLRLDLLDELMAASTVRRDVTLPVVSPDDPVQIQYTSGTTGFPKGVVLRHGSVVNNARLWADRMESPDGAGWLQPTPLFHTSGCVMGVLGALDKRAKLVLMPMFEPGLFLELIELERPWFAGGVPTMLVAAMDHPDVSRRDLSSWRSTVSGGAAVPEALVRRIEEELGVNFTIVYGQTECSPVLTSTSPSDSSEDKGLTVGPPLPQTEVRIVDPVSLETVPIGTSGELWARGYFTMLSYFEKPEESLQTLRADGWLRTGDLATMDERGYCRSSGRLKDMIIRGGEGPLPAEIEEVLYRHPGVAEVAVVGLPDDHWGEVIGAFIRPRDPTRCQRSPNCVLTCGPTCHRRRHPQSGMPWTVIHLPDPARSRSSPSARRGNVASTPASSSAISRHRSIWCGTGTNSTTLRCLLVSVHAEWSPGSLGRPRISASLAATPHAPGLWDAWSRAVVG